jgi:hypothetical protein
MSNKLYNFLIHFWFHSFHLFTYEFFLADYSHVVLVKKVIRTWLNGMKLKGLLRGHTMASGNVHSVLFSLTQLGIASWLLEMNFLLNSGIWITITY